MQEKKQFYKKLAVLVLPIAVQNLMTALVSASDALMLGFLDQSLLSAVSLATQVQFVLNLFYAALTIGSTVLAAQYWGKGGFPFCREDPRRRIEERPARFCSVLLRSACGAGASHEDIRTECSADLRAYRIPADGDSGGCSCDNHLACG